MKTLVTGYGPSILACSKTYDLFNHKSAEYLVRDDVVFRAPVDSQRTVIEAAEKLCGGKSIINQHGNNEKQEDNVYLLPSW